MASPALHELASAIAAMVSAIGGAFAAIAAFRSAAAARDAARSADDADRRAMLREVSAVASAIQADELSVRSRAVELSAEYKSAEVFSGATGHSGIRQLQEATGELAAKAAAYSKDAESFRGGARSLADVGYEDIDRVLIRLSENLSSVHAIRDELERKYAAISAQNAQNRQIVLQSRMTK